MIDLQSRDLWVGSAPFSVGAAPRFSAVLTYEPAPHLRKAQLLLAQGRVSHAKRHMGREKAWPLAQYPTLLEASTGRAHLRSCYTVRTPGTLGGTRDGREAGCFQESGFCSRPWSAW